MTRVSVTTGSPTSAVGGSFKEVSPDGPPRRGVTIDGSVPRQGDAPASEGDEPPVEASEARGGIGTDNSSGEDTDFFDSAHGSELGSTGNASDGDFSTLPMGLGILCHLREFHCRCIGTMTVPSGNRDETIKLSVICARKASICKRHRRKRDANPLNRCSPGYYRLLKGNGDAEGPYYTKAQMQEIKAAEAERLARALEAQNANLPPEDARELESLTGDLQEPNGANLADGQEDSSAESVTPPPRQVRVTPVRTGRVATRIRVPKKAPPTRDPFVGQEFEFFFGLEGSTPATQIVTSDTEAIDQLQSIGLKILATFRSEEEGRAWEIQGRTITISDDSSEEENKASAKSKKKKSHSKATAMKDNDVSEEDDDLKLSSGKKKAKGSTRKSKKRSGRKGGGGDDSSSSSSSSSDSTETSSDSSDESSSHFSDSSESSGSSKRGGRGKKGTRHSTKKTKWGHKSKAARRRRKTLSGPDPSVGNSERIYKKRIQGTELDKVLLPQGLRSKDGEGLFDQAVDVTALPGMLSLDQTTDSVSEEAARNTEFAATLLATSMGSKGRAVISDTLWRTGWRHGLHVVKSRDDLYEYVKNVEEAEHQAFRCQADGLEHFLLRGMRDPDEVDEYIRHGPLTRLTLESYRYYCQFLNTVRQLAYEHPDLWEKGPAQLMLEFHSRKLLTVRSNAISKRHLVLETYAYLRDAHAKSFYHDSLNKSMWTQMATLTTLIRDNKDTKTSNGGGGGASSASAKGKETKGRDTKETKKAGCTWCKSHELHEAFGAKVGKAHCPLGEQAPPKARKIGGLFMTKRRENPSGDAQSTLDELLAENA